MRIRELKRLIHDCQIYAKGPALVLARSVIDENDSARRGAINIPGGIGPVGGLNRAKDQPLMRSFTW